MEDSKRHLEELHEIRSIMERSTRFLSLSGWSGIMAGMIAIIGATLAFFKLGGPDLSFGQISQTSYLPTDPGIHTFLLLDMVIVLILAVFFALLFSWRKAKISGEKIWSPVTKRLLVQLMIPLVTGGLMILFLIWKNELWLIAPATLIFYGLALVSAAKYTNVELVWLGIAEISIGFVALLVPQLGIYFWATGFGIFHIIYGITLYRKYDRKPA